MRKRAPGSNSNGAPPSAAAQVGGRTPASARSCAGRRCRAEHDRLGSATAGRSRSARPEPARSRSRGFASALALVERFASGQLWRYPDDHAQLGTVYQRMTWLMLAFSRRPALRRLAVRHLSLNPELFSALLALSANTTLPSSFRFGGLLRWLVTRRLPLRV